MKKKLLLMVLPIVTLSASAQKKENTDTLRVTPTPQMHCANCENKIKSNIRFVKGVKKIETSIKDQQVTIVYDKTKSDYDKFVAAFSKIGFEIKRVEKKTAK